MLFNWNNENLLKILHTNQIFIYSAMRAENGRIFLRLLKHLRVLSEWIYVLIFLLFLFIFRCDIKIAAFKHFYGMMVIFHEIFTVLISLFIHPRPIYVCAKINPRKEKLVINIKRFRGVFTRWNFNSDFMISPLNSRSIDDMKTFIFISIHFC